MERGKRRYKTLMVLTLAALVFGTAATGFSDPGIDFDMLKIDAVDGRSKHASIAADDLFRLDETNSRKTRKDP